MASLYLRDLDDEFVFQLKRAALDARKSLRQHVLDLIAAGGAAEKPRVKKPAALPDHKHDTSKCRIYGCFQCAAQKKISTE